jgi:hypothetical protein
MNQAEAVTARHDVIDVIDVFGGVRRDTSGGEERDQHGTRRGTAQPGESVAGSRHGGSPFFVCGACAVRHERVLLRGCGKSL